MHRDEELIQILNSKSHKKVGRHIKRETKTEDTLLENPEVKSEGAFLGEDIEHDSTMSETRQNYHQQQQLRGDIGNGQLSRL